MRTVLGGGEYLNTYRFVHIKDQISLNQRDKIVLEMPIPSSYHVICCLCLKILKNTVFASAYGTSAFRACPARNLSTKGFHLVP